MSRSLKSSPGLTYSSHPVVLASLSWYLITPLCLHVGLMSAIQTTSSGILDHEEARRKNVGGKILGYVY